MLISATSEGQIKVCEIVVGCVVACCPEFLQQTQLSGPAQDNAMLLISCTVMPYNLNSSDFVSLFVEKNNTLQSGIKL